LETNFVSFSYDLWWGKEGHFDMLGDGGYLNVCCLIFLFFFLAYMLIQPGIQWAWIGDTTLVSADGRTILFRDPGAPPNVPASVNNPTSTTSINLITPFPGY
jgi:hypothetical protein